MKYLRSPALHMLLIGGLLFAGSLLGSDETGEQRPPIEIPEHRVAASIQVLTEDLRRTPTDAEKAAVIDNLIDQEILFHYAMDLGMHHEPVVQRRLAQIAGFVDEAPSDLSEEEAAQRALDLGLHEGDLLARRILADGATRLIRSVVLIREPPREMVESYFEAQSQRFLRPGRTRIAHVSVNRLKHGDATEDRAQEILQVIRRDGLSPEAAVALGDEPAVPPELPSLADTDFGRRFGYRFADALAEVPVGSWGGPVPSRYGLHLVYVHERVPASVPPLDEIYPEVARRMLHRLADEWLELRLLQLRSEYPVRLPEWASALMKREEHPS